MNVLPPLTADTILRDVRFGYAPNDVRLTIWETGRTHSRGTPMLAYRLCDARGEVLVSGADYSPSPSECMDSDESVRGLISFLTLRPGDTDSKYFDDHSVEYLNWVESYGEECQLWGMELEYFDGDDDAMGDDGESAHPYPLAEVVGESLEVA